MSLTYTAVDAAASGGVANHKPAVQGMQSRAKQSTRMPSQYWKMAWVVAPSKHECRRLIQTLKPQHVVVFALTNAPRLLLGLQLVHKGDHTLGIYTLCALSSKKGVLVRQKAGCPELLSCNGLGPEIWLVNADTDFCSALAAMHPRRVISG